MFLRGNLIVENVRWNGIPCLHTAPAVQDEPLPAILLCYGWGSNKEDYRYMSELLALSGRHVIIPELPLHGERDKLDNHYVPQAYDHFWDVVTQAVEEVPTLLDSLVQNLQVNANAIDICGSSMGGMIACAAFARESRFRAMAVLNGASDWQSFEVWARRGKGEPEAPQDVLDKLRAYEPLQKTDSFAPRRVLLMHGGHDRIVPMEFQRSFYEKLLPLYHETPDRLTWMMESRLNHYITLNMLEELTLWLQA